MVESRTKIQMPQGTVDAFIVPIEATYERTTEVDLEDGSKIRVRSVVQNIYRLDGKYDDEGNPIYVANVTNTLSTTFLPPKLRRPVIMLPTNANFKHNA